MYRVWGMGCRVEGRKGSLPCDHGCSLRQTLQGLGLHVWAYGLDKL